MKILYPILIALVSLVMVFNFFSGIVGGIWLVMTGGLSLVITGIIVGFLMPYVYSLVVMPSMGLIVLTEKALNNKNIILAAILGFLASLWEKSITWFWVVLVFYYFIGQSGHFNPFALILAAYATAMAPLQSMASHEEYASNGNAGLGTTMGLFYAQLIFLVIVLAWIINFSPVWLLWILTFVFVSIPTYIIIKSSNTTPNDTSKYSQTENIIDATEINQSANIATQQIDPLMNEAIDLMSQYDKVSASLFQRRLQIGWIRANDIINSLYSFGLISPAGEGENPPREVLIKNKSDLEEIKKTVDLLPKYSIEKYEEKEEYKLASRDEIFPEVKDFIKNKTEISVAELQKKFTIGYSRAARIMDHLKEDHLIDKTENYNYPAKVLENTLLSKSHNISKSDIGKHVKSSARKKLFCSNCGERMSMSAKFCKHCGFKILP